MQRDDRMPSAWRSIEAKPKDSPGLDGDGYQTRANQMLHFKVAGYCIGSGQQVYRLANEWRSIMHSKGCNER